jgi:phage shock protein A
MSTEHEQQADAAERQLEDMERRSDQLGNEIDEARQDWRAKQSDSSVPGASGDPDRAEEGGRHPETAYPGKGPKDELGKEDPADNDRGVDDTPDD